MRQRLALGGAANEIANGRVELYAAVRLAVVDEGLSHREAGGRFGIDHRTVSKMVSYLAPPGYRWTKPVRRAKLDGFTGIVDAILEAVQVHSFRSLSAAMTLALALVVALGRAIEKGGS